MIILSANELTFENAMRATLNAALNHTTNDLREKLHLKLTEAGIPLYDTNENPLQRYCHYLHAVMELPYEIPNHPAVNDVLFNKCGSRIIWILAE